jgi:phospholipase/carboxylesterase
MQPINYFILNQSSSPSRMVLFLHGLGASGNDLVFIYQALLRELNDIIGVFPTAPNIPVSLNRGYMMPAWFDIESITHFSDRMNEGLSLMMNPLVEIVREVQDQYPSITEVNIVGFSQGGVVALALSHYVPVNHLALLSTFYPQQRQICPDSKKIFIAHGEHDDIVPFQLGSHLYNRLKDINNLHINFYQYKNMGHHIINEEIADLIKFIKIH